jgi:HlyD family secretion protein
MNPQPKSATHRSIRRHVMAGIVVVTLLAGGVGGWAATTELSSALIAQGSIVVDSNVKKVQHPTGGIVGELRARDGDHVKMGDILVRLDDTVTRANLSIIDKGLVEFEARKARLEAERDGADDVAFPNELMKRISDPAVGRVLSGERKLFELRRSARAGQKAQLQERVAQLREEVHGLSSQQEEKSGEIELIHK